MKYRRYLHVKVGDSVMVIAGSCKKSCGVIIDVDTKSNMVKVGGVNFKTHYVKKDKDNPGSMQKKEGWLHASNVRRLENES